MESDWSVVKHNKFSHQDGCVCQRKDLEIKEFIKIFFLLQPTLSQPETPLGPKIDAYLRETPQEEGQGCGNCLNLYFELLRAF